MIKKYEKCNPPMFVDDNWLLLKPYFAVGCCSHDSMGKGKPQLYRSGTYHIGWYDLNLK